VGPWTFRTGVQLFNKSMLKPAADQPNPDHTRTPQHFMLWRIYILFSKFNNLSTGFPDKLFTTFAVCFSTATYRGAGKSLARPGRKKQARKHVRDARDFNNIETRAVIKLFFLQDKAPMEIYVILTETLACFLPGRAKDLSAPLYNIQYTQMPRGLRCRSAAARCNCGFESGRGHGCLLCVVRQRSLRRANHSSRGILSSVVYLGVMVNPQY